MAPSDPTLTRRARAKTAYETGRLRTAARQGLYVAPLAMASLLGCHGTAVTIALTIALYGLTVGFLWRGLEYGRAVGPGLIAGAAPLLLPMALRATGHGCLGGICWTGCMTACIVGGLAAGAMLAWRARSFGDGRRSFLLAAAALAMLAGSLGCMLVGVAGVVGMIASLLIATAPVLLVPRRA